MRAGTRVIGILTGLFLLSGGIAEARPPACGTGNVWRVDDTSGAWQGIWVRAARRGDYLLRTVAEGGRAHRDSGTRGCHPR